MNTETESPQPLFCCQCGDKSGPFRAWDFTRKGDLNCIPCSVRELDEYIDRLQGRRHQIDLDTIARLEETVKQLLFRNEQLERESTSQKNGIAFAEKTIGPIQIELAAASAERDKLIAWRDDAILTMTNMATTMSSLRAAIGMAVEAMMMAKAGSAGLVRTLQILTDAIEACQLALGKV